MKKLACILLTGLAVFAVFKGGQMRLNNLETRAVHPDEGEQTWTFARLLLYDEYKYDPHGPHGPILYYWPLMSLDKSDTKVFDVKDLRKTLFPIYPATAAAIFLFALLALKRTNRGAQSANPVAPVAAGAFAALLFAYSSLSQIYSTYFVQETFFALFSILFACSFYYLMKKPSLLLALATGLSAGFLQSTKETSVFVYAASALACAIVFILKPREERAEILRQYKFGHIKSLIKAGLIFAVSAFAVYTAFYSSFGANWRGIWDGAASYFIHFLDKSSNPLHTKEFLYYFKLLAGQKSEYIFFGETGIFILSTIGTAFAFMRRNDNARFIALFAWISLLLMSLIGYKMPWLMFSPLCALCIIGGVGVAEILRLSFRPAWASIALKLALLGAVLWLVHFQAGLARTASAKYPSDPRNPFLYVHTLKDSERLVERVKNSNRVLDGKLKVLIAMKNSPWPLPWQFARLGATPDIIRTPNALGDISQYSIIVYDADFEPFLVKRFDDKIWLEEYFGLRENLLLRSQIKRDLFEKSLEATPTN